MIRRRVSYNQNDETLSLNSLRYLSNAGLTVVVNKGLQRNVTPQATQARAAPQAMHGICEMVVNICIDVYDQTCISASHATLRVQSRIRYSLSPPGFGEFGIHLVSATGKPLEFLWIHIRRFIKWAEQILDSEFISSLRGLPT